MENWSLSMPVRWLDFQLAIPHFQFLKRTSALALVRTAAGRSAARSLERSVVDHPLDVRRHQSARGRAALGLRALTLGHELDADGPHLLLEIELVFVRHALRSKGVAERAQSVQTDRTALRHELGHDARQLAQNGHDVGVGHGTHGRKALGHFLRGYRLAHGDGGGIPHAVLFVVLFLVECHSCQKFCVLNISLCYRCFPRDFVSPFPMQRYRQGDGKPKSGGV